ncbi:U3 snoRNP protein [Batrachochytrium dendrobatidis]|nr:U3 snoRNP protein [Batrachochytrium dendrobatidis]
MTTKKIRGSTTVVSGFKVTTANSAHQISPNKVLKPTSVAKSITKLKRKHALEPESDREMTSDDDKIQESEESDQDLNDADMNDSEDFSNQHVLSDSKDTEASKDVEDYEAPTTKRARSQPPSKSDSLFKAPTNEEMHQFSQTNVLYKSNLFKMQIDELVREVTDNLTKTKPLEKALRRLKSILDSIPSRSEVSIKDAISNLQKEGISIPFGNNHPPADTKCKFSFEKPSKVAIVGSFLLKTTAKTPFGVNVDMSVQMPEPLFQEKDHVNHRYFHKRAYYLAVIAAELEKESNSDLGVKIEFEAFQNDLRKPILVLTSTKAAGELDFRKSGFCIRIFPTVSSTVFSASKLAPVRNNVRLKADHALATSSKVSEVQPATPHYNTLILQDTVLVAHLNFLHHHISESPAFKDACILARVWLAQRGISESQKCGYGMSGFLMSMIMGWLLRATGKHSARKLGKGFSSYQMFKITIDFIAELDFTASPLFLTPSGEPISEPGYSAEAFLKHFDVAVVDPSGRINLAAHITQAAMDEIQREAKLSSAMFKDQLTDNFDSLFLKKVDQPLLKYDNLIRIPGLTTIPAAYKQNHAFLDFPDPALFMLRYIPKLLKKALTDRTVLVTAFAPRMNRWSCSTTKAEVKGKDTDITVGLILHCENSLREVEMGPAADDTTAVTAFRLLWGEKAETRRFKDGSITESVVFESDHTLQQRSLIVCRMAAHLLARHANILPLDGVTYWAGLGGKYIKAPGIESITNSFQPVLDAFQSIMKQLTMLKGLPLSINTVIPIADALRYSSTFVPQPKPSHSRFKDGYRPYIDPLSIIIEFESSGRWPENLRAIQNMKRAFYIRIKNLLETQYPGTQASVSIGSNDNIQESGWLDVIHTSGYVFRCQIHLDKEFDLLNRTLQELNASGSPAALLSTKAAQRTYLCRYVYLPWHATHMKNQCLRLPFLPVTIRILKRWLASHLLLSSSNTTSIPEEALELLAAYVYLHPAPFEIPNSGYAGFLRVLDLIQSWDWKDEPLIVELERGKMTFGLISDIKANFKQSRQRNKTPPMYIATERDLGSEWWTTQQPSPKVLERLVVLARSALVASISKFDSCVDNDISQLFTTPLAGYSLIIHLNTQKCTRFRENLTFTSETSSEVRSKFKNLLTLQDKEAALLWEFDPVVCYIRDLETAFSGLAMFFHDKYGGDKIAVVWNRAVLQNSTWKTKLLYNACPDESLMDTVVTKGSKLTIHPNIDAMIAEMERLGNGLVLAIERR